MLNSILARQQKFEQLLQFHNQKLDELIDRNFINDKVARRLEAKLDRVIGNKYDPPAFNATPKKTLNDNTVSRIIRNDDSEAEQHERFSDYSDSATPFQAETQHSLKRVSSDNSRIGRQQMQRSPLPAYFEKSVEPKGRNEFLAKETASPHAARVVSPLHATEGGRNSSRSKIFLKGHTPEKLGSDRGKVILRPH